MVLCVQQFLQYLPCILWFERFILSRSYIRVKNRRSCFSFCRKTVPSAMCEAETENVVHTEGGDRTWSCARTRLLGHHMTLFTCYSFLVSYIAYFVYVLRLPYIVKQRKISGVAGEHPYVKIERNTHLMF